MDLSIAQTLDAGAHPGVVGAGPERTAEPRSRVHAGDRADRALEAERELFDLEGLREEVEGARADRRHGRVEAAEGRDHQHR